MVSSDFPNTVSILGRDIEIRIDADHMDAAEAEGHWEPQQHLIRLHTTSSTRSEEWLWYVLGHELAHALTELIGREDLSKDEGLMDTLGAGIIQIARTLGREEEEL